MKKESVCHLNRNKDKHHLDLFCYSSFSWHDFLFVSQSSILAFPVFCFFPPSGERRLSVDYYPTALSGQTGILLYLNFLRIFLIF